MTYNFTYPYYERDTDDPQARELPTSGSLEYAIGIARDQGVTIQLSDEPGFPRGVVYASGGYMLRS